MGTELVHIQFGHYLPMNRVVAIMVPNSDPVRRLVEEYKSNGKLLDLTHGDRRRALILLDDGKAVLAAVSPETIAARLANLRLGHPDHIGEST